MLIDDIKKERERFVAFAFAAAEIFFEIEQDGTIVFEGGASDRLNPTKKPLVEQSFFDLVHSDDREFLRAMLEHLGHKGRLGPLPLRFRCSNGKDIALRLFALQMPEKDVRTFIALRSAPIGTASAEEGVDAATGLLNRDSFMDLTARTMAEEGGALYVTAVQVDGIKEARDQHGANHAENLLKRIAAHLKTLAVDGTTASRIGEDQFAFLHRGRKDGDHLTHSLSKADGKSPLKARAKTLQADAKISESEIIRTLGYVLQKFIDDPENCDFDGLAAAYDDMAVETKNRLTSMRSTIEAGTFSLVFQPIVRLEGREVSHHEVLSRFSETDTEGPAEIIKFAEEVGIIEEFDLSLVAKSIDYIRKMKNLGTPTTLAINISGRSLDVGRLSHQLVERLIKARDVARNIVLELTETKTIQNLEKVEKILGDLKAAGYRICLDDFGAGASGYQYLRVFNVDMVKIEGSYIREMNKQDYRPTFLLSMVRLCEDLKVQAIGEHVETKFQADFLKSLGVRYGQGFYFGRPTLTPQTRI